MENLKKKMKTFFVLFCRQPGRVYRGKGCLQCRINCRLDSKWTLVLIKSSNLKNIRLSTCVLVDS